MKTELIIEITSPDRYEEVTPEEGETIEDYKEKKGILIAFQEQFAKDVHKEIIEKIKGYILDENHFEDDWLDSREETWVDGWDSFDDYKIRIIIR